MLFFKRNPNNNLQKEILTSRNSIISYIQDFLYKCFCPPCKKNAESVFCNLLGTLNLCLFKQTLPCMSSVAYTEICPGGGSTRTFQRDLAPKNAWSPLEISVNSFSGVEALPTYPAPVFGPGLVLLLQEFMVAHARENINQIHNLL